MFHGRKNSSFGVSANRFGGDCSTKYVLKLYRLALLQQCDALYLIFLDFSYLCLPFWRPGYIGMEEHLLILEYNYGTFACSDRKCTMMMRVMMTILDGVSEVDGSL